MPLLSLICVALFTFGSTFARESPPVVDLGYARYQGVVNPTTQNTEFLGIRYAAPPIGKCFACLCVKPWLIVDLNAGDLRWRQPKAPQRDRQLKLADTHPNICHQSAIAANASQSTIQTVSEDCLFLR